MRLLSPTAITLDQIVTLAQQLAVEKHQYYVGVEHLIGTLSALPGSLTGELLKRSGVLDRFNAALEI